MTIYLSQTMKVALLLVLASCCIISDSLSSPKEQHKRDNLEDDKIFQDIKHFLLFSRTKIVVYKFLKICVTFSGLRS